MTPGGTIAALASAQGASPRAVVRVSGSLDDLDALFAQPLPRERTALPASLRLGEGLTLPALVAVSIAPASYTGEDSLDILIPGGPAIVARVLARITAMPGVRHAEAGEFTARAFANGRIDLQQARGVAATIAAANAEELRSARALMDSAQGAEARGWSETLSRLLALVEAGIDFADQEDVVAIRPEVLASELSTLASDIASRIGSAGGSESRSGLARVALVGAPSAGKSTLFNALLGRPRSVVHAEPGTTRDAVVEELVLPGGGKIELVDLAGLDSAASNEIDRQVQRRAQAEIDRSDAVVLCDASGSFGQATRTGTPTLRVRTKADLPQVVQNDGDISVCALDGWHLDDLRAKLAGLVGMTGIGAGGAIAARMDTALRHTCGHLDKANSLAANEPPQWELIAGELRLALDQLGLVTGRIDPDEVLGLIFKTFCIGK